MLKRWKSLFNTVWGFSRRISEDHVAAYAAQSAYFIILAFIPFVMCLMTIVKYTTLTKEMVLTAILQICPANLDSFISGIVDEVYDKSLAVIPFSALIALWSAGKGLQAVSNGLNTIYHVKETRNWLISRIRSVIFTVILVIALLLSLMLLVFGNGLYRSLKTSIPFLAELLGHIMANRLVLVLGVLILVFLFLFKVLPNRKATFRSQLPGAILTSVCWMTFSYGFSLYFTYYSSFSNMYGSLTTIVLVMLWLYMCMTIVLCGAEVNAYFEKQFRQAHEFARELFDKEDSNSGILHEKMDDYFDK